MRKYTELRLELWTVIAAAVLAVVVGFMLLRMGSTMKSMDPQAMMMQMMAGLDKALEQVNTALTHADEALKAPDLGALKKHVGLAQGTLSSRDGAMMQMQMMQGPMTTMKSQGMMVMSMEHHTNMMAALEAIRSGIKAALEHLGEAVQADKLETAQEHVHLATGQLQAAKGMSGSSDPKTGALMYLKEQMAQMMGRMKGGSL